MIVSADYFRRYTLIEKLWFVVDIFLISLLYLLVGLVFSAFFNGEVVKDLDRNQSTLSIFFEVISQACLMIFTIFLILHFLPKLPTLIKNAPHEHIQFRLRGADILLAFSIVACELKFLDKLRFLYNEEKDFEARIAGDIFDNWANCTETGDPGPGGEFVCVP